LPKIPIGPAAGERLAVHPIIAAELSPGIDRVLANLELGPPRDKSQPLGDVEIAAAIKLSRDLERARIIDSKALERILSRYDKMRPK